MELYYPWRTGLGIIFFLQLRAELEMTLSITKVVKLLCFCCENEILKDHDVFHNMFDISHDVAVN